MSSDKRIKKDKEIFLELEAQIKDIKHQLNEQLRCLDQRLESQVCMAWELQDFYQRRAEVETDYSKNLDKLVKQTMARHKAERQKREQWQVYSAYKMWQTLLGITIKQSKNHVVLAEAYSSAIAAKFTQLMEDMQRVYKKCREMTVYMHDELTKVVTELHSSMKTYHVYHGESQQAETKYQRVESQRLRLEQENKKGGQSKRLKSHEKQCTKYKIKYDESNLKSLKSRNEYLLSLDSANGAIRKFFVDDLPELINVMDYSYHISLGQVMMYNVEMEETISRLESESLGLLSHKAKDLNQRSDRQAFLQQFHQIFSLPKKFEFQPHKGDEVFEVSAPSLVRDELVDRLKTITERLYNLKLENDEIWKTLETTDSTLLEKRTRLDIDVLGMFGSDRPHQQQQQQQQGKVSVDQEKQNKTERLETEEFYLSKFKSYQFNSNLIARLQAKCATIERALTSVGDAPATSQSDYLPKRPLSLAFRQTKKRHFLGKASLLSQPKLFGGSIEEYVQATGHDIPTIVRSCTRIINLYGMHHQGVFRISGSLHEINDFKNLFERGEEPVLSKIDSRDINSVAGVLKLYFRELPEPLFPLQLFDELIACACPEKYNLSHLDDLKKCINRIQELLLPLPRPILVVIRYLFSFLNHLSEYSDENMMDAHNLAVCFGPTLLPVPSDHEQVRYQNYVNELIRVLIVHQDKIFPNDGGPVYEKCIVEDDGEDSLDSLLEDAVGDGSEEDVDPFDAVAIYNFNSRNSRELSFQKGDALILTNRVSPDWWEGTVNNQMGLVPHKYIAIQARSVSDKDSVDAAAEERMRISTESLPSAPKTLFGPASSSSCHPPNVEPLDRSISQPNIFAAGPPPPSVLAASSSSSASSDLSGGAGGGGGTKTTMRSLSSKDPATPFDSLLATTPTADDGDGRRLLTTSVCSSSSSSSFIDMEPTPVLVLNLPFSTTSQTPPAEQRFATALDVRPEGPIATGVQPVPSNPVQKGGAGAGAGAGAVSPSMTNADLFASVGQGTIKKRVGAALNRPTVEITVGGKDGSESGLGVKQHGGGTKPGSSPDSAGTDEMLDSTLDEIEKTLSSGFAGPFVSASMMLLGIGQKVQSSSSVVGDGRTTQRPSLPAVATDDDPVAGDASHSQRPTSASDLSSSKADGLKEETISSSGSEIRPSSVASKTDAVQSSTASEESIDAASFASAVVADQVVPQLPQPPPPEDVNAKAVKSKPPVVLKKPAVAPKDRHH